MNGISGSFVIVALIFVAYLIATKKFSLNLSGVGSFIPDSRKLKENLWKFLFVLVVLVAIVAIIYWGFFTPIFESPRLSEVGSWSWNHWLPLLALWGIGSALLKLQKKEFGAAEPILQSFLVAMMVTAFLVSPIIGWFEGAGASSRQQQPTVRVAQTRSEIPIASTPQSSWPKLVIPAGIGERSERISVPFRMHTVLNGNKFRLHNVYQDGSECVSGEQRCVDGPLLGIYATNETNEINIISYAFAPD